MMGLSLSRGPTFTSEACWMLGTRYTFQPGVDDGVNDDGVDDGGNDSSHYVPTSTVSSTIATHKPSHPSPASSSSHTSCIHDAKRGDDDESCRGMMASTTAMLRLGTNHASNVASTLKNNINSSINRPLKWSKIAQKYFEMDYYSRPYMTYRSSFKEPIYSNSDAEIFTSDRGWGCMLRTAQMLLAQGMINLTLGRDYRLPFVDQHYNVLSLASDNLKLREYYQILQLFEDMRSAPYSIHNMVAAGVVVGKDAGHWFGPFTVANVLQHLVKREELNMKMNTLFSLYVALDGVIYKDDVCKICSSGGLAGEWLPLIILFPLRLGVKDTINPIYIPALLDTFTYPQSLGFIGGKPGSSYYFIASQGYDLFYLDPHTTQPATEISKQILDPCRSDATAVTYRCKSIQKINITKIDPSLALGVLCRDKCEFVDLCERIHVHSSAMSTASASSVSSTKSFVPIISVAERRPDYTKVSYMDEDEVDGGDGGDVEGSSIDGGEQSDDGFIIV